MKSFIKVRWQFEGFHFYKDAPKQVQFLQFKHRHLFKCTAKIQVNHDDRELEFFIIQRALKNRFGDSSQNGKSCEMIAKEIIGFLHSLPEVGVRNIEVEVSEDGENSAVVEFNT